MSRSEMRLRAVDCLYVSSSASISGARRDRDVGMMIEARAKMCDEAHNLLLDFVTSSSTSPITPVEHSIKIAADAALDGLFTLWDRTPRERERSLR